MNTFQSYMLRFDLFVKNSSYMHITQFCNILSYKKAAIKKSMTPRSNFRKAGHAFGINKKTVF